MLPKFPPNLFLGKVWPVEIIHLFVVRCRIYLSAFNYSLFKLGEREIIDQLSYICNNRLSQNRFQPNNLTVIYVNFK